MKKTPLVSGAFKLLRNTGKSVPWRAGSEMFRTRPPQYAFGRVFSGLAAYPIARR